MTVTVFRGEGDEAVGYEADAGWRRELWFCRPRRWRLEGLDRRTGYYPVRTSESVLPGQATNVTYYLEKASYNPYDVVVRSTRPRKEVSRTVIKIEEIDKVPGTAGDPLRVIANLPGVARPPGLGGQIIVRGSAPTETLVFVDGVSVPNIYHFGGLRSVIPVGMLDGIEFYPGNFGPEYGRAIGGIVDVIVNRKNADRPKGYADVSLLDTSLYFETPLGQSQLGP